MSTATRGCTHVPDVEAKIDLRDKNVPWYAPELKNLGAVGRELLENYSKIPSAEVEKHVYKMRDEIWEVFPYPCVGEFRFVDVWISLSTVYPSVLQLLKSGEANFLDLGCCVGQVLRKLVHDGAVAENLYGVDLRSEFFEMGYRLFLDRATLKSTFIEADIMDPESALSQLDGKMDIICAGSLLHLFNYEEQVGICKRLVKLSRGKTGSLIWGRQVGSVTAGEYVQASNKTGSMYRHNAESFKKMWHDVGKETGTSWRVEYDFEPFEWVSNREEWDDVDEEIGRMVFSVFRE